MEGQQQQDQESLLKAPNTYEFGHETQQNTMQSNLFNMNDPNDIQNPLYNKDFSFSPVQPIPQNNGLSPSPIHPIPQDVGLNPEPDINEPSLSKISEDILKQRKLSLLNSNQKDNNQAQIDQVQKPINHLTNDETLDLQIDNKGDLGSMEVNVPSNQKNLVQTKQDLSDNAQNRSILNVNNLQYQQNQLQTMDLGQIDSSAYNNKPDLSDPRLNAINDRKSMNALSFQDYQSGSNISVTPGIRFNCLWISKNEIDQDISCDVCQWKDHSDGDEFILCDGCNVATHQSCYGNELVDQKDVIRKIDSWFCMRCVYLMETQKQHDFKEDLVANFVKCYLCPDRKGLITRSAYKLFARDQNDLKRRGKIIHNSQENVDEGWAHPTCVQLQKNIWYKDKFKKLVVGKGFRLASTFCRLCKQYEGQTIECDFRDCTFKFHVRCGMKGKLIPVWDKLDVANRQKKEDDEAFIFCDIHRTEGEGKLDSVGVRGFYSQKAFEERQKILEYKKTLEEAKDEEEKVNLREKGDYVTPGSEEVGGFGPVIEKKKPQQIDVEILQNRDEEMENELEEDEEENKEKSQDNNDSDYEKEDFFGDFDMPQKRQPRIRTLNQAQQIQNSGTKFGNQINSNKRNSFLRQAGQVSSEEEEIVIEDRRKFNPNRKRDQKLQDKYVTSPQNNSQSTAANSQTLQMLQSRSDKDQYQDNNKWGTSQFSSPFHNKSLQGSPFQNQNTPVSSPIGSPFQNQNSPISSPLQNDNRSYIGSPRSHLGSPQRHDTSDVSEITEEAKQLGTDEFNKWYHLIGNYIRKNPNQFKSKDIHNYSMVQQEYRRLHGNRGSQFDTDNFYKMIDSILGIDSHAEKDQQAQNRPPVQTSSSVKNVQVIQTADEMSFGNHSPTTPPKKKLANKSKRGVGQKIVHEEAKIIQHTRNLKQAQLQTVPSQPPNPPQKPQQNLQNRSNDQVRQAQAQQRFNNIRAEFLRIVRIQPSIEGPTRVELQQRFIQLAISQQYVCPENHHYKIVNNSKDKNNIWLFETIRDSGSPHVSQGRESGFDYVEFSPTKLFEIIKKAFMH